MVRQGRLLELAEGISIWLLNTSAAIGSQLTKIRLRNGRMRSLWGVTPILTLPLLARCDRALGIQSDSLVFTTYYITNQFDINLTRWQAWILAKAPAYYTVFCRLVMSWALLRYDIFHLFCDRGLLPPSRRMEINPRELELYSRAGKSLFTYAYGADVRTREATLALGKYNLCKNCPQPGLYCQCSTEEGESNTGTIKKYATAMVAMGDMLAYIPQPRNMHYWPLDLQRFRNVGVDWAPGKLLRVAHVPNHAHFKGTEYLIAVIDRLLAEGWPIELLSAQGVPNEKVLEIYASADIVADQFIAGFHGYAALEAMALGKPVLCFIRNPELVLGGMDCPIINVGPDGLYSVLRGILDGHMNLKALGEKSRDYVARNCSISAVAGRMASMYLELLPMSAQMRDSLKDFDSTFEYLGEES